MSENKNAMSPELQAIMQQYKDSTTKKPKVEKTNQYDLKNYHSNWIPDNVKSGQKQIRILPVTDANGNPDTPFKTMFVHSVQVDGKWVKLPCPKANHGKDCPFCQAREQLFSKVELDEKTGKEVLKTDEQLASDKEIAKKYYVKKMWVVKVIDRALEEDGVKFYRFWDNSKQQGIYNKIMDVYNLKGLISSPSDDSGRDIITMIGRDDKGNPTVTSIQSEDKSVLSDDPEKMAKWLADDREWTDVYSEKSFEYLAIIVKGGNPVWDKETNGFIDKADLDKREKPSSDKIEEEITMSAALDAEVKAVEASANTEDEDDLPF